MSGNIHSWKTESNNMHNENALPGVAKDNPQILSVNVLECFK